MSDSYVDCYGLRRDKNGAIVVKPCDDDPAAFNASDALVMAELSNLKYSLRSLGVPPAPSNLPEDAPTALLITSPNMDYVPDLSRDSQVVQIRKDGRFYTHDFTLFPQHYFEATSHLPFIRLKPSDQSDPIALIWYKAQDQDFVAEPDSIAELYRLRRDLVDGFLSLRKKLSAEVDTLLDSFQDNPAKYRDIRYTQRGMRNASVCLDCAPQTRLMTLLTMTSFQRFYLETLAWYDFYKIWSTRVPNDTKVDRGIVGAWTCNLDTAQNLFQLGIPVWLVRAPYQVTSSLKVVHQVFATLPDGIVADVYPNTSVVFKSPPSPLRNRVSQAHRTANVDLGPSANVRFPNDPVYTPDIQTPSTASASVSATPQPLQTERSRSDTPTVLSTPTSSAPSTRALSASAPSTRAPTRASSIARSSASRSSPSPLNRQVNLDKFKPFLGVIFPPANESWTSALAGVNTATSRIRDHPFADLFRGYVFPDPWIFAKTYESDKIRASKLLFIWSRFREAWVAKLQSINFQSMVQPASRKLPSPQHWRSFLIKIGHDVNINFDPQISSETSSNKHVKTSKRARKDKTEDEVEEIFDIILRAANFRYTQLRWLDSIIKPGTADAERHDIGPVVGSRMVWELCETNWRLEFLALDRCLVSRLGMTEAEAEERDNLVRRTFADSSLFITGRYPTLDNQVGAREPMNRIEAVEAMRQVVVCWPDVSPELKKKESLRRGWSTVPEILAVEKLAVPFYCQTFFDYFGRACTIPRILP